MPLGPRRSSARRRRRSGPTAGSTPRRSGRRRRSLTGTVKVTAVTATPSAAPSAYGDAWRALVDLGGRYAEGLPVGVVGRVAPPGRSYLPIRRGPHRRRTSTRGAAWAILAPVRRAPPRRRTWTRGAAWASLGDGRYPEGLPVGVGSTIWSITGRVARPG
jgi:hypothetical protein